MFFIEIIKYNMNFIKKNFTTIFTNDNLEETMKCLNITLSELQDEYGKKITIDKKPDNTLEFIMNDIYIETNVCLTQDKVHYLLFNKKIIQKLSENDLAKLKNLEPDMILNIFTHNQCMINPYYLFIKILNTNEEAFYQTFILYLNKSISQNNEIEKIDMSMIIETFFNKCDNVNYANYKRLLNYYLATKRILPYMIKFVPYHSNFD
jgi:hypothetical protein